MTKLFRSRLIFSLFIFFPFALQAISLSDSSRISLLTCSSGEELYSAFGHNGIRVTDFKQNFDIVFNYGTFDFNQEGFYVNFVRGKMRYMVSVDEFKDFMAEYIYSKRSVTEQELNLTTEDRGKIFAFLYTNALPENREYYYDFFWDNCATRPRDVFEKTLRQRLQYQIDSCGFEHNKTMHDMLRLYVHNRPWIDFGFDLSLGLPCEKIATARDQTFLPDFVAKLFSCATVDGHPFVIKTQYLLAFPLPKIEVSILPIHVTTFLMIIGFAMIFIERKRKAHYYRFDFAVFFIAGLLGSLLLSLWLFTVHYSVPKNLNMLWLIPSHLYVSFLLLKQQKPLWLRYYFLADYLLMIVLLLGWKWIPQPYNYAVIPLIILLAARSFSIFHHLKLRE